MHQGPSEDILADAVVEKLLRRGLALPSGPAVVVSEAAANPNLFEQYLERQVDRLRDEARTGDPAAYLRRFMEFHDDLPADASGTLRFRAKANIGHRHLALGNGEEASRWLLEAFEAAPDDTRAITNRVLGLWIRGDVQEAYAYGRDRLSADPTNAILASYLPQIAIRVPEVVDGLDGIPEGLRDGEEVALAKAVFLRGRDMRPDWYECARSNIAKFPEAEHLRLLAAFADLDEMTRDEDLIRTQILTVDQRTRLTAAVTVLDAYWQAKESVLHSHFDDARYALVAAMLCYHLLQNRVAAIARATRIADERFTEREVLVNAVQIAMSCSHGGLAARLIALAPEDGELLFCSGILAIQDDRWDDACAIFARSTVPEAERRVVETVAVLVDVKANRPGALTLRDILDRTLDSARGLVLVGRVAIDLKEPEIASKALSAAVARLGPGSHIATRLMVGGFAEEYGTPRDVIKVLDGYLPNDGYRREHVWLSAAHANDRPHHPRNLSYFDRLPAAVRDRPEIARAHAALLFDINRVPDALAIFQRLHAENPSDAFVAIRLLDALRKVSDLKAHARLIRAIDPEKLAGRPDFIMAVLGELTREGFGECAYPVAYDLVRRNPGMPSVALSYVGLSLLESGPRPWFERSVAGLGACVEVRGTAGGDHVFVIDEGPSFLGISVEAPDGARAKLVEGKRKDETYEVARIGGEVELWRIASIRSKYLYLHQLLADKFEALYPGTPGIARYTVGDGDISQVLAVIRRVAEESARRARAYVDHPFPLAAVARSMGGDPVSFARYLVDLGHDIATCEGTDEPRIAAVDLARRFRGGGVALDPYTTWVAAEMGLLPTLKDWFGVLHVPDSFASMIEKMIARERNSLGQQQMTMAYRDSIFWREEVTDDVRCARLAALGGLRDQVTEYCTLSAVLVPDETSEDVDRLLEVGGEHLLDAAFLSAEKVVPLLSEDLRYRQWTQKLLDRPPGLWLQALLMEMLEAGVMPLADYADAVVGLAARRHGHVSVTGEILHEICRRDTDKLPRLREVLRFIGNHNADMLSHTAVTLRFIELLWRMRSEVSQLRRRAATGAILEALLSHRREDWRVWLSAILKAVRKGSALGEYLADWMRGHFLISAFVDPPAKTAEESAAPVRPRRRKSRQS